MSRSWQNTGSDEVAESDLATSFGKCQILTQMTAGFRKINGRGDLSILDSALGLAIEGWPGLIVFRALKPMRTLYLAILTQFSIMTRIHEMSTHARALAQLLEREAENDDPQTPQTISNHEALHEILRACEDPTSSFKWDGATEAAQDIFRNDASGPIPVGVLEVAALSPMPEKVDEGYLSSRHRINQYLSTFDVFTPPQYPTKARVQNDRPILQLFWAFSGLPQQFPEAYATI